MGAKKRTTRQRVLDAALALVLEGGEEAASIAAIREACGVSVGSIYHHFGNKQGILTALYEEGMRRHEDQLVEAVEQANSPRRAVVALVREHVAWSVAQRDWAMLLHQVRRVGAPAVMARADELDARLLRALLEALAPALARGSVSRVPEALYLPLVLGPARAVVARWLEGRGALEPGEVIPALAQAAWRAIAVD